MKDGLSSLEATGPNPELSCNIFQHTWIFRLQYKDANRAEYEDTMSSIIPLESCLHLDPSRRITPKQALKHSFIRVIHLVNDIDTNSYADDARQLMAVCPMYYSDKAGDSLTHT